MVEKVRQLQMRPGCSCLRLRAHRGTACCCRLPRRRSAADHPISVARWLSQPGPCCLALKDGSAARRLRGGCRADVDFKLTACSALRRSSS